MTKSKTPRSPWGTGRVTDPDRQETIESSESLFTRSSERKAARSDRRRGHGPQSAVEDNGFSSPDTPDEFDRGVASTLTPPKPKGPSLKARAVDLLSRREHSRLELSRKLARHSEDAAEIEAVLNGLEKEGWLSGERFAQSLVHRRAPRQGVARVVQELRQHGVSPEQIAQVREDLKASEVSRAREVWLRRFGRLPLDAAEKGKQMRFLMSRGFGSDAIRKVLSGAPGEFDDG